MNPATIIGDAKSEGVILALSVTGTIKATGEKKQVDKWLPLIRENKSSIINLLTEAANDARKPTHTEPFNREAFEERAAICEFDGGLSRDDAEAIAWHEDDRRRCAHCLNIRYGGVCKLATPGGIVSAQKGYRPDQSLLQRCAGYRPSPDDPDRRTGQERWPEFYDIHQTPFNERNAK